MAKFLKFFQVSKDPYYWVDANKRVCFQISAKEFGSRSGLYVELKSCKFKVVGVERAQAKEICKSILWGAESVFDVIGSFLSNIRIAFQVTEALSKAKTVAATPEATNLLMGLGSLCLKVLAISHTTTVGCAVTIILDLLLECARIFLNAKGILAQWRAETIPIALLISAASMFLPKGLFEVFKRISTFTQSKVLDDATGFYKLFVSVGDFLNGVLSYLPFEMPQTFKDYFKSLFSVSTYALCQECESILKEYNMDKHVMLRDTFRVRIRDLSERLDKESGVSEWERRSPSAKAVFADFRRLVRMTTSYEKTSRVEPSCFVFEGPPGVGKSVIMNKLIGIMNMSSYVHTVKTSTDGKDFYDMYGSEDIFLMDDVGQQGISQWRTVINMVAPVKLPLDCASAELKDTKFFDSKLLFLTTNEFTKLHGLLRSDGIADIRALWRRGYVFRFDRRSVCFSYYDAVREAWMQGFPNEFMVEMLNQRVVLPTTVVTTNQNLVLAWMKKIVSIFLKIKEDHVVANTMTEGDLSEIDRLFNEGFADLGLNDAPVAIQDRFAGETIADWTSGVFSGAWDHLKYVLEVSSNFFSDMVSKMAAWVLDVNVDWEKWIVVLGASIISMVIVSLVEWGTQKFLKVNGYIPESFTELIKEHAEENARLHPTVNTVKKQVFEIDMVVGNMREKCIGLLSGRHVITISHATGANECYLTAYKNRELKHIIIDNAFCKLEFKCAQSDIAVWALPRNFPTPFKNISHVFSNLDGSSVKESKFVHPMGVLSLDKLSAKPIEIPTLYSLTKGGKVFSNYLKPSDVFYKFRYPGLCGGVVLSDGGKFIGLHVAGSSEEDVGAAIRVPEQTKTTIFNILNDFTFNINATMSDKDIPDFSGIKLAENHHVHVPKETNYIPTPLHGVFPISRVPAQLSVNGPHTVKDVAKKSFTAVQSVDAEEIEFGKSVMMSLIDDFEPLSMSDVISGTSVLAAINRKSSNGLYTPKTKEECIDYEKGELKEPFKGEYDDFLARVNSGKLETKDLIWFETLKDELRGTEKVLPRSFRVSKLSMQLLTKTVFGNMVEQIVKERWSNQIMVGVNPYKDWSRLYSILRKDYSWAGDVAKWDGAMLPQVQNAIGDILKVKFKGDSKLVDFVIGNIIHCYVAVQDDTFVTTHSMPSGSFLTAILNSLVNRFYTAMWFYRSIKHLKKPTVSLYTSTIVDFVYGDDKLNVLLKDEFADHLNAVTMKEFFVSIGMDFTDSKKKPIATPFQRIDELTFLKRSFVFHPYIQDVVGPLDLSTIFSTLSFFDCTKETDQVLSDKLSAFQREIFLHTPAFAQSCVSRLKSACEERAIQFIELPFHYLLTLYKTNDYPIDEYQYGLSQKTLI